jgi:CheY-like chemotaxis protein
MSARHPTILLVEDNDEDVFLLQRAFRKSAIECNLQLAQDGQEAIEYLGGEGKYSDRNVHPVPALVLLDLKLPYVHGFEVLSWISSQPGQKDLRVIILTSSGEERDRDTARQHGIEQYFTKPPTPELVAAVVRTLKESGAPVRG